MVRLASRGRWSLLLRAGAPALIVVLAALPAVDTSTQWAATAENRRLTETRTQVMSDMEQARYYGEASTMNARLATALADDSYSARHRTLSAQLGAVLADAQRLTADAPAGRDIAATVRAGGELAAQQHAALDELTAGRPAQGYAILTSPRFVELERRYQESVQAGIAGAQRDLREHAANSFTQRREGLIRAALGALSLVLTVSVAMLGWRRSRREQLREGARSTSILDTATVSFVELDSGGRVLSCNRRAQRATGWSSDEARRRLLIDVAAPVGNPDRERWAALVDTALKGTEAMGREITTTLRDGRTLLTDVSMWPSSVGPGRVNVFVSNVTERATLLEQLRSQALTDPLTGLPNRRALTERLEATTASGQQSALLMVDLDEFKVLNDAYGHGVGDLLLQAAAVRIGDAVSTIVGSGQGAAPDASPGPAHTPVPGVLCARLGGDEFAVLLVGTSCRLAEPLADELVRTFAQPVEIADGAAGVILTASIGFSRQPSGPEADGASDLLAEADLALYAAKAAGRRRWVRYDRALRENAIERATIEHELRAGLPFGEVFPHYQPIIRLSDGVITGVEALARWQHPTRGLLPPSAFVDVAEQSDLVIDLGMTMLAQTCAQLAAWDADLGPAAPSYAAVNLSARHLSRQHLVADIAALLQAHGLAPHRLVVEVTEAAIIDDTTVATANMHRLADRGVRLAVDDFGTGHSSLGRLRTLPVHILKIDRSFVAEIGDGGAPLVELTLGLAASLGLDVVAEGVETTAQHDYLTRLGCRNAQGYLYARPTPAEQVGRLCEQRSVAAATTGV